MAPVNAAEIRSDIAGLRLYASRNHNQLRQTYDVPGACRANLDWNVSLRQVHGYRSPKSSQSLPALHTSQRLEGRQYRSSKEPLVPEHEDGPYQQTETVGKLQNFAATKQMLNGLSRVSSGSRMMIDWQLNLRDGFHGKTNENNTLWRKHCLRAQNSFDLLQENCRNNEAYQNALTTPQDRRVDRSATALPISTIRDDPMDFTRWHGCEGANTGQWKHLIEDRRHGHKSRRQIQFESMLHSHPEDPSGAKLSDNRSEGCIVEMLGKKKWRNHISLDPLAQRPPLGDPKLHHMSHLKLLAEPDEENRTLRMTKQQRRFPKETG